MISTGIIIAADAGDYHYASMLLKEPVDHYFQSVALESAVRINRPDLVELLITPSIPERVGLWNKLTSSSRNYCSDVSPALRLAVDMGNLKIIRIIAERTEGQPRDLEYAVYAKDRFKSSEDRPESGQEIVEMLLAADFPVGQEALKAAISIGDPELLGKLLMFWKKLEYEKVTALLRFADCKYLLDSEVGPKYYLDSDDKLEAFVLLYASPGISRRDHITVFLHAVRSHQPLLARAILDLSRIIPKEALQDALTYSISNSLGYLSNLLIRYGAVPTWEMFSNDFTRLVLSRSSLALLKVIQAGIVGLVSQHELEVSYHLALAYDLYTTAAVLCPEADLNREFAHLTFLDYALRDRNPEVVALLISDGVDFSKQLMQVFWKGNTLLHVVALSGDLSVVRMVIQAGADPSVLNTAGKSFITQLARDVEDGAHSFRGKSKWFHSQATSNVYDHYFHAHEIANIVQNQMRLPLDISREVLPRVYGNALASHTNTDRAYDLNQLKPRKTLTTYKQK